MLIGSKPVQRITPSSATECTKVTLLLVDGSTVSLHKANRGLFQISFDDSYNLAKLRCAVVNSLNDRRHDHTDARRHLGLPELRHDTLARISDVQDNPRIVFVVQHESDEDFAAGTFVQIRYLTISSDGNQYSHDYATKLQLKIAEAVQRA